MGKTNKIIFILFIASFMSACSSTKYVGKEEFLLERVNVKVDDHHVNRTELKRTVRQKTNTRILGASRFHLWMYNLSGRNESKNINKWLRRIGEAPVIYSPFLTEQSTERMKSYLMNKGYYDAEITDTAVFKRRKAFVTYRVKAGPLTTVNHISFKNRTQNNVNRIAEQSGLQETYYRDTVSTLLHTGMPLDMDVLDQERDRITQMLREKGYFNFSKQFIQFFADSSTVDNQRVADLFVRIVENTVDTTVYKRYFVQDIVIDFDYDPLLNVNRTDTLINTLLYDGYRIYYREKLKIRPKVITETIQIHRMELYNVQQVLETYTRLQALNLFRFINIEFREIEGEGEVKALNCIVQLTPLKRQSYNVFVEGTNTSGNFGVGGNFVYSHRNLFKGGENFSVGVWGTLKKEQLEEKKIFNTHELGAEVKFVTPQFWLPLFRMPNFRRDYAPKTSISIAYSYENTPYYTRSVANARFGYLWRKADKKWRYNVDVVDLNYVWMKNIDQDFLDTLKNEYIKSAYKDHMILSAVFTGVYTDQLIGSTASSYNYFRMNLESSGNFLWAIDRLSGRKRKGSIVDDAYYTWLGVQYAQFIKADAEYRYNWQINKANTLVWRFFIGCGYPYGNMKVMPFEESYYSGGANDQRAWQVRTLGPGSFQAENGYPNSVGDFKLAANMEYRFKLFWLLEGALFVDAGNVWNISRKENRQGTKLTAGFLEQIAIGTGAGLRINANYFLLRFDWGFKVKDPAQSKGKRFVLFDKTAGGFKHSVFNIAIGYPF